MDTEKFSAAIFRRGQKKELFDDGDDGQGEEVELDLKLQELTDVWNLPRQGKDLAAAIWRPQHNAAEVVLQKGRLFNHIGFMWGKTLFLHIEEAVYLIDRANLLLFEDSPTSGKRLISLQESQELMLRSGFTMDMFLVYCKLMRAGYIVQRHPFTWVVKSSETPTQIWSRPSMYDSRTNRLAAQALGPSTTLESKGEEITEEEEERAAKRQRKEQGNIEENAATKPAAAVSTATEKKTESTIKVQNMASWWSSTTTSASSKNPWASFIDESALPRCIVRQPAAQRALTLFPNMQPLHHLQPSEVVDLGIVNKDGVGMLHFDVFAANSQFSRKLPGRPLYSMSVYEGGAPPSLLALNAADQASNGIPVRYSGVEHGDISYFAIARAELHKIIT